MHQNGHIHQAHAPAVPVRDLLQCPAMPFVKIVSQAKNANSTNGTTRLFEGSFIASERPNAQNIGSLDVSISVFENSKCVRFQ
jgi:hypothetical protein